MTEPPISAPAERFAPYVATLGRGPGRSRALTRDEAREAFRMVLAGEAEPLQVGAFLMLLRYRGEDPEELTGLVEAARAEAGVGGLGLHADLDWPSYGAGRTRGAPWFLLAALALARAGLRVLMHGSNEFSSGLATEAGVQALGLAPARHAADAGEALRRTGFAYLPLRVISPRIEALLGLRRLFGLRSPVNTVARLLNPADAAAGVDGVFHPPYIAAHLGVAERMGRPRFLVVKGGGGEAERSPAKPLSAHLWRAGGGHSELALPAWDAPGRPETDEGSVELLRAVWSGEAAPVRPVATVCATIALALLALGRASGPDEADELARVLWAERRAEAFSP